MELTKNLQLKKPAENDFYNVADFNENADILDTAIKGVQDGVSANATAVATAQSTANNAVTLANNAQTSANAKLPFAGGTMSGRVSFNYTDCPIQQTHTTSGKSITMGIGSGGYNRGIFDTDSNRWIVYADQTGNVSLNTTGSTGYTLNCGNDGTLTWKGKDVITSAGGKFTGSVTLMGGDNGIVAPTDNDCIEIEGGTKYGNGAKLTLYGKSATQNGEFRLSAINDGGVNPKHLSGKVDGSLTWADKNIVRSVNGTNADANGNVTISLPSPTAYVTATWMSGNNWYRKWSDGWIEQGGWAVHGAVNNYTLTFPVAFKDTKYTAVVSPVIGAANGTNGDGSDLVVISGIYNGSAPYGKTKTTLRLSTYPRANDAFNWYACGY